MNVWHGLGMAGLSGLTAWISAIVTIPKPDDFQFARKLKFHRQFYDVVIPIATVLGFALGASL